MEIGLDVESKFFEKFRNTGGAINLEEKLIKRFTLDQGKKEASGTGYHHSVYHRLLGSLVYV